MKAKKLLVLGLSAFAAIGLAACGGDQGGDDLEARKKAVDKVANQGICTSGGEDMIAGTTSRLEGPATLSLARQSQAKIDGKQYTVEIEWTYDQATYGAPGAEGSVVKKFQVDYNDETHYYVSFNYSTEEDLSFALKGSLKCGEGASKDVDFAFTLGKMTMVVDPMTHEEFYHVASVAGGKFKFDNWQGDVGGNKYAYDNKHYVQIAGKLTYMAPDGNFGYVDNGDRTLALYWPSKGGEYATLQVGHYFEMDCYIATYYGYPQLSNQMNINEIEATDPRISEPTGTVHALTGKQMNGVWGTDAARINQFSDWHHKEATIRGTYKAGSLDGAGKTDGKNRFTFVIVAEDGTEVTIQHNYHVDNKTGTIGKPIIDVLNGAGSNLLEVKGRLTYASTESAAPASMDPGNQGGWTLTPLTADAVKVVAA